MKRDILTSLRINQIENKIFKDKLQENFQYLTNTIDQTTCPSEKH